MTPTHCRMVRWDGPLPEIGHYLKTSRDSLYLIIGYRPNLRVGAKSKFTLDLLRLDGEDERDAVPADAFIHNFKWGV